MYCRCWQCIDCHSHRLSSRSLLWPKCQDWSRLQDHANTKEDFLLMELAFQMAKWDIVSCLEDITLSDTVIRLLRFLFICDEEANLLAALWRIDTMDVIHIFDSEVSLSLPCQTFCPWRSQSCLKMPSNYCRHQHSDHRKNIKRGAHSLRWHSQ